jgi:protein SCO1
LHGNVVAKPIIATSLLQKAVACDLSLMFKNQLIMKRKTVFYIVFFSILVIGFYVVLIALIPNFRKSHYPPISVIKPFSFTNQDGVVCTEKTVAGKVYVVDYFFTTCTNICPVIHTQMKRVYERFRNEPRFLILSHTSDPRHDSPERLKRYADSMGVAVSKWIFLTGRKDSLYNQARFSYMIDDPKNNLKNPDEDFLHTQFFALVNKKGQVVKIYDGLKEKEVDKLIKDAEQLLKDD